MKHHQQADALVHNLHELAYNLWWSWNHSAREIFRELSPFVWDQSNHNPVEVLNWVSGRELTARLRDPEYRKKVTRVYKDFRLYMRDRHTWGHKHARALHGKPVAYFSAEFGLHECLRTYSGGLGILSGDHTKSASDIGLPFVGVGLLYNQGYFQQRITPDGWQQESYLPYDPERLPLELVRDAKGLPVIGEVQIGTVSVKYQAWVIHVGRVQLHLLDTNIPQNEEKFRNLTAHVYGGDQSTRIGQEILLGIGGVRLLRALGIHPAVFHMNEGHSAFLTLELLREQLLQKRSLEEAQQFVQAHCVFTTHTPVPAGHDRFDHGLMNGALSGFASTLGLSTDELMRFGRVHPENPNETFCMTVLALRLSRAANGVSALNGEVSREMWRELYPDTPLKDIPIGHVTNGIHTMGWAAETAATAWEAKLGTQWCTLLEDARKVRAAVEKLSDEELWTLRTRLRRELIEFVRRRLHEQHLRHGGDGFGMYDSVLLPDALTIGFARRFATYKRAPLFFRNLEWAIKTLTNAERPVQLIFAGKAHPRDDAGKHFIQQIVRLAQRADLFGKVVFLEDYDINVARHLVAGADLWLNTPRRPMEACGTSGQKVLIHGALNLSTMDGWWREAYNGKNGWKVGEDAPYPDDETQDNADAASIRSLLDQEVIPLFFTRGRDGIPHGWLKRVRHSIISLIPVYNTRRMVEEYTTRYYLSG
jgi:starch phosphorylase